MTARMTGKLPAVFLVMGAAVFFSCSQAKPEILYGKIALVQYENGGTPVERFSFFVLPSDGDGFDDLDELWLYHDWEGLSWCVTAKDWVQESVENQLWIGSRAIQMEDGSPLPRGQFRAVIVDKSGERTEQRYSFDAPGRPFPRFTVKDGMYAIESAYPQQNLVAYDNEGNYIITVRAPSNTGDITTLGFPSHVRSVALWAFDPDQDISAFTDVVPLD